MQKKKKTYCESRAYGSFWVVRPPPSHVSGIGKAQFGGLSYALGKQKQRRRNGLSLKTQLDVRVLLQLPTALSSISPTCLLTLKEGKKNSSFHVILFFFFFCMFQLRAFIVKSPCVVSCLAKRTFLSSLNRGVLRHSSTLLRCFFSSLGLNTFSVSLQHSVCLHGKRTLSSYKSYLYIFLSMQLRFLSWVYL